VKVLDSNLWVFGTLGTNARAERLLARVLAVQPKDVPLVVLAFAHADREPTILTNDESFAGLAPADHGAPELSVEHVA